MVRAVLASRSRSNHDISIFIFPPLDPRTVCSLFPAIRAGWFEFAPPKKRAEREMSTQAARSILLTHQSTQQGFRLLELPRELAGILSSDDAPLYVFLVLPGSPLYWISSGPHVRHHSRIKTCLSSAPGQTVLISSPMQTRAEIPVHTPWSNDLGAGIREPLHPDANLPSAPGSVLKFDPCPSTEPRSARTRCVRRKTG